MAEGEGGLRQETPLFVCHFCREDMPDDECGPDDLWSTAFDAPFHKACLQKVLEAPGYDPEADPESDIIAREYGLKARTIQSATADLLKEAPDARAEE